MTRTILLGAVALAACAQTPSPATDIPAANDPSGVACKADALTDLVGQPASAALGATAMERAGARTVRWIQPNSAVTMDFRFDRLNIMLDDKNAVTSFTCG
ncbi:I78 family peptidase inhibitor [Hephaestia sp. GCM10023244]|uniref:I78 family peptidase inhibitor n=1 Tax=unclassified Hephaestia TaxID=2631281 RepID=UPI0020776AED|nr:I78 family peptidase inhibitor [Hephaestia sp. MAHUQ-44]MCM8731392.1 I78 family peptidase inhibitor [Hephaestia sp. MAHUQ-44]